MDLAHWVSSIVAFVRAGYPTGMPTIGYVPLAALSRRRASNDEITAITSELIMQQHRPISSADAGVAIGPGTASSGNPGGQVALTTVPATTA